MTIQSWPGDVIVVELPPEPGTIDELKEITDIVCDIGGSDVVIDFARVGILTSRSISELLKLRELLAEDCYQLVLCGVGPMTKGIFNEVGLEGAFQFVNDKSVAMQTISG